MEVGKREIIYILLHFPYQSLVVTTRRMTPTTLRWAVMKAILIFR